MKRIVGAVGLLIVAVFAVMVIRALRVPAPTQYADAAQGVPITVDTIAAGRRLAGAIKFPTVSLASGAPIDTAAFLG
ncbi:MAG: M20 family peptidase, partial [Gemmatimonadaceae bacterium]